MHEILKWFTAQEIADWLKKTSDKSTSLEIQNELVKLMSHTILRELMEQFHNHGR